MNVIMVNGTSKPNPSRTPVDAYQYYTPDNGSGVTDQAENRLKPFGAPKTSPVQAGASITNTAITTDFAEQLVLRHMEMLHENSECILYPTLKAAPHCITEPVQDFTTSSHHLYRPPEPGLKPRSGKKTRGQRQRGIPTLSIPEFESPAAFFDWIEEEKKKGEERRRKISRLHKIITWLEERCLVGSLENDASSLQSTEKLKQDCDKLTKKAQKWDMQLATFSLCHLICRSLVAAINKIESDMKGGPRKTINNDSETGSSGGPGEERHQFPGETALYDDYVGTFMLESRTHDCRPACPRGLEAWAHQHREMVLKCINEHAGTVRGKSEEHGVDSAMFVLHLNCSRVFC